MEFKLIQTDSQSKARAGQLKTDHGVIETPIFMPVGTIGSVKGISSELCFFENTHRLLSPL